MSVSSSAASPALPDVGWPSAAVLLRATATAAIAEAVLLRSLTRTLIHIPGIDAFERAFRNVAEVARFTYYLAVVLIVALLVGLIHDRRAKGDTMSAWAITVFLVAAAAARLGLIGDVPVALAVLAAVGLLVSRATRRHAWPGPRLCVIALGGAFVLVGLHTLVQLATAEGLLPPAGSTALLLLGGEVLAILGALLAPTLIERTDRVAVGAGLAVAVVLYGALAAGGSTVRILMLWNLGLGGWLPNVLYAAAAAAVAYTAVAAWRAERHELALGLALLVCGGFGLHSTYQSGLAVAGFAVLAIAVAAPVDRRPITTT